MYGVENCPAVAISPLPYHRYLRRKKLSRGALHGVYWRLNYIKCWVLIHRGLLGVTKWERSWVQYVFGCWDSVAQSGSDMWRAPDIIYGAFTIFSNDEYLGETRIGMFRRGGTHNRLCKSQAARGRMRFYRWLYEMGPHCVTYIPLRVWAGSRRATKRERLTAEGWEIYERQSTQNDLGRTRGSEASNAYGERVLLGRARRSRQLLRFRTAIHRSDTVMPGPPIETLQMKQSKLMPLLFRCARRPWKRSPSLNAFKICRIVRGMKQRELNRFVSLAQLVLDPTNRSIFFQNLKLLVAGMRSVCTVQVTIRSPLLALQGVEDIIMTSIRRWIARWNAVGIMLIVRATLIASRSPSTLSVLDSTAYWASKSQDMVSCACQTEVGLTMDHLQGHVLQPLQEWLVRKGSLTFAKGWTMRSRLTPNYADEVERINDKLSSLSSRTSRLLRNAHVPYAPVNWKPPSVEWSQSAVKMRWKKWQRLHPGRISVDDIYPFKALLRCMVVSPIDKWTIDGVVMCPCRWHDAIKRMAVTMREVSPAEEALVYDEFFRAGRKLKGKLPHCNLKKASEHRFGVLKVWVKKKSIIGVVVTSWDSLSYRPLVSYWKHHWRTLLSLAGKYCMFVCTYLGWGYCATRPKQVMKDVEQFNRLDALARSYKTPQERAADPMVSSYYDIKEFYTHVHTCELYDGIQESIDEIHQADPSLRFF